MISAVATNRAPAFAAAMMAVGRPLDNGARLAGR
jgi:hypothetical protein